MELSGPAAAAAAQEMLSFEARKVAVFNRVKAVLDAGLGAVNAPNASFADAMFLSKELVVLLQATRPYPEAEGSSCSQKDVKEEMEKFEFRYRTLFY
jgi:hypothetical protein